MAIIYQKRKELTDGQASLKVNTMNFASGAKIYLINNEISTDVKLKKLNPKQEQHLAMDGGQLLYL
jgi:hypothetical protein